MRHGNLNRLNFVATNLILFTVCAATFGQGAPAAKPSATPLKAHLPRFTAPDVPALGPAEIEVPAPRWLTNITAPPANLPGKGLAQHPMLYIGEGYNKMFLETVS